VEVHVRPSAHWGNRGPKRTYSALRTAMSIAGSLCMHREDREALLDPG